MAKTKHTPSNNNKKMSAKGTRARSTKGSNDCKANNEAAWNKEEEEVIFDGIETDFKNLGSRVESLRRENKKVSSEVQVLNRGYKKVVNQVNDTGRAFDQLKEVVDDIKQTVSYLAKNAITKHDIDGSNDTTNEVEDDDDGENTDDEDNNMKESRGRRKVLMDIIASHDKMESMEKSLAKLKDQLDKLHQDQKANAGCKVNQAGRGLWSSSADLRTDGSIQITLKS